MSNGNGSFFPVNVTAANGCPDGSSTGGLISLIGPYSAFVEASPFGAERRCGYIGAVKLDTLSRCCSNSSQIETSGQSGGGCGYLCPYNGTLTDWASCLNNDTVTMYCLRAVPVQRNTTADSSTPSAAIRRVRPSKGARSAWILVLATMIILAMLLPTASAAALSSKNSLIGRLLPARRQKIVQCSASTLLVKPYIAINPPDYQTYTDHPGQFQDSNSSQVVTTVTLTVEQRIISTFPSELGDLSRLLCAYFTDDDPFSPGDSSTEACRLDGTQNLETSFEFIAPKHSEGFANLQPAYLCIHASIYECYDGSGRKDPYFGIYCITHRVGSTTPLAVWSADVEDL